MKILVAWDVSSEADLLELYLGGGGENEVVLAASCDQVVKLLRDQTGTSSSSRCVSPTRRCRLSAVQPDAAAGRCPDRHGRAPEEMINLPRFLIRGLRYYLYRDPKGDFIFLVLSTLESAIAAMRAEEERKLVEHLREEINGVRLLQEAIIRAACNRRRDTARWRATSRPN